VGGRGEGRKDERNKRRDEGEGVGKMGRLRMVNGRGGRG